MKFESAFFCDDVRTESSGKKIFIGAYIQDILLTSFPSGLNLNAVICYHTERPGNEEIEVEVRLDDQIQVKGKLTAKITAAGFGFLVVPVPLFNISGAGKLVLRAKKDKDRWKDVVSIQLKPMPAAPIEPIAPSAS